VELLGAATAAPRRCVAREAGVQVNDWSVRRAQIALIEFCAGEGPPSRTGTAFGKLLTSIVMTCPLLNVITSVVSAEDVQNENTVMFAAATAVASPLTRAAFRSLASVPLQARDLRTSKLDNV
jgi:hypothetical protein